MTALAHTLGAALRDFIWQGLLVAFLLWTTLGALKNRSARARYAASCAALAAMAILPLITAWVVSRAPAASPVSAVWAPDAPRAIRGAARSLAGSTVSFDRWALPLWALGVLFLSLRLVWASRQISALRRRAEPIEGAVLAMVEDLQERLRLVRPVRVLVAAAADCPSVVGWIRPVVLLPASTVMGLTPQQLEAVLAHELAHILRYDYVVNLLQTLVETLLFYHPAVWWASARIRQERELCCDDLAVASCGDALCYARALTRLERLRAASPRLALGSTGGSLMYRIQRLTGQTGAQRGPSRLPGIVALSLGLLCFALNMQWARGQQAETPAPESAALEATVADEPGVRVDLGGASVIHRIPVEYPEQALENGVQGAVVVEATLDAQGVVNDARVLSGPLELRKAALESILQWHFANGEAGGARQVSIEFRLPATGDTTAFATDQRARATQQRDLARAKREQDLVQALVQKKLAERMAEAARDMQSQGAADAAKSEADAQGLMLLWDRAQVQHKLQSEEFARLYAQQALANQSMRSAAEVLRDRDTMAVLQKKLAELQARSGAINGGAMFAGQKLKSIHVAGLSDALRGELLSKLPVRVGDNLSDDSIEKVQAAVDRFDEHLEVSVDVGQDGQVEIRIAAPGAGDRVEPQP